MNTLLKKQLGKYDINQLSSAIRQLENESNEKYKSLFVQTTDAMIILDRRGHVLETNPAAEEILGFSKAEMAGKSVTESADIPGEKVLEKIRPLLKPIFAGKSVKPMELELESKSGKKITLEALVSGISKHGQITGLQLACRDITEKKRNEEELARGREAYKQMIDKAPLPIIVQKKGIAVYANAEAVELTGYSPRELVGSTIYKHMDRKSRRLVAKAIVRTIGGLESARPIILTLIRKKGDRRTVRIKNTLITYENEPATIVIFEDITEIVQAETTVTEYARKLEDEVLKRTESLIRERERVEDLSRVKDEFIRNITHELKTPLSVILGSVSLLEGMGAPGREKDWAELIELLKRNGLRLAESIDQVLNLTKLDTAQLNLEKFGLRELVEDVIKPYQSLADAKGIYIRIKPDDTAVTADRHLLRLAISNLISNAVKFTNRGGMSIAIRRSGSKAVIAVADTGVGIAKEDQKRLFIKFFKADPTAPGTGIGLTAVKQIMKKHRGTLTFKSAKNRGSTFILTLPVH